MRVLETALDAEKDGVTKSVYLVVPEKAEELSSYIRLKDRETQEGYELSDEGVVISEKLSELLGVKAGDTILLKEDETDPEGNPGCAGCRKLFYALYLYERCPV